MNPKLLVKLLELQQFLQKLALLITTGSEITSNNSGLMITVNNVQQKLKKNPRGSEKQQ